MLGLQVVNEKLMYDLLSIPSYTGKEYRLRAFISSYAEIKGYECQTDNKGNLYLCKGEIPEGGYYPCLTAHMDTVQAKQVPFVKEDKRLKIITEVVDGQHKIYTRCFGLGGDDKAGIVVALSIMDQVPVCKAVFFVEEEQGCRGSREASFPWFNDVGYVIAFDAPEYNCASWSCWGVSLFDRHFYETYLAELGTKLGLTKFYSHPYTDIMVIREKTQLACMNFGSGYYNYHLPNEYCIAEEIDKSASLGIYLVNRLGIEKHFIPYVPNDRKHEDEDRAYFTKLFG